jgi:hypothetical protein
LTIDLSWIYQPEASITPGEPSVINPLEKIEEHRRATKSIPNPTKMMTQMLHGAGIFTYITGSFLG